jgi:hypothetical protein
LKESSVVQYKYFLFQRVPRSSISSSLFIPPSSPLIDFFHQPILRHLEMPTVALANQNFGIPFC